MSLLPIGKKLKEMRRRKAAFDEQRRLGQQPELPVDWDEFKPVLCDACYGIGTRLGKPCARCGGEGVIPKEGAEKGQGSLPDSEGKGSQGNQ